MTVNRNFSRRQLMKATALGAAGFGAGLGGPQEMGAFAKGKGSSENNDSGVDLPRFEVVRLTSGPKHHFFGYYGMTPWNLSERLMVCLETEFQDHLPSVEEPASIGVVDPSTGEFTKVTETRAWNLQQGALLHWNPVEPEREIVFNDRRDLEPVSAIVNVESGEKRWLPRPISGVCRTSKYALSLTYGRLARLRKVVGYVGAEDPNPEVAHPEDDGVFLMDLETGKTELIVSIAEVYDLAVKDYPVLKDRDMWFNHTVFNRSDSRFLFLARSWGELGRLDSAMYTANRDGSDLRQVTPWGGRVSHFDWRNDHEIIATFLLGDDEMKTHYLFTDGKPDYAQVGNGFIAGDGHCTFSPGEDWLATDGSLTRGLKKKYLANSLEAFNIATGQGVALGTFNMGAKKYVGGNLRCDLHPRWNRTGNAICFDAMNPSDWTRQLHVAKLDLP